MLKMDSVDEIMQLCRLCLVKDEVNIPIFEEQGDIRQIFLKISACLPVKVSREDNLPKNICDGCSCKLEALYQFWNTSANSEKKLMKWLSQGCGTVDKAAASDKHSMNVDPVVLKQEVVEVPDDRHSTDDDLVPDDLNVSNDADDYLIQQQQLPYQNVEFQFQQDELDQTGTDVVQPSPPSRKRRAAAIRAMANMGSEDEANPDLLEPKIAKTEEESEESCNEDPEPTAFVGLPSATDNEQPGPSGVGKPAADAPSHPQSYKDIYQLKEAVVVLEKIDVTLAKKIKGEEFLNVFGSIYRKPSYICTRCGQQFDDSLKLKRHTMVHKLKARQTKKKLTFRCYICVKQFSDRASCWNHMRVHSALQMGQNCKLCRMNFKSAQALSAHASSCPSNNSGEVTNVKPKCCVCMMECASVEDMRTHRLMHAKKRRNARVGGETKEDQATGDDNKNGQGTGDEKKMDRTAGDEKRNDWATGDEKKIDWVTGDEKKNDWATGDEKNNDWATGDEKNEDQSAGDDKMEDQAVGDEEKKDQAAGDETEKDQAAGDETQKDQATGDEKKVAAPPPQFKCCHQIFHSFDLLCVHLYHTYKIWQESRCFPQYVCSICSTTFNERGDWCYHSVKRHDCNESTLVQWGQPLKCDRCQQVFTDAIKVVQHKLVECKSDDLATTKTDNSQKKVVSILVTRPTNNLPAIYNVGTKTLTPVGDATTEIIPTAPSTSILKTYSRRVLKHDAPEGVKTYERKKTVLPILDTSLPETDDVITLDESDEETPQNRMYACKLCTFKTTKFPLLEQHCSGSHKIPFVCPKCTNWYMSSTLFRLHQCPM